jgi:hypothetical protein
MKEITTKDLKESLTLLTCQNKNDGAGGWKEEWRKGPKLWASVWPILGGNGFHMKDQGGPMASQCGYIHAVPSPHYRLVIRTGMDIPPKSRFIWHLRHHSKNLLLVNMPVLIQYNRFQSMTVVEEQKWENFLKK